MYIYITILTKLMNLNMSFYINQYMVYIYCDILYYITYMLLISSVLYCLCIIL